MIPITSQTAVHHNLPVLFNSLLSNFPFFEMVVIYIQEKSKVENKILMKTSKHHQFEMENDSWLRRLEFFIQENAILKYRLSEIVDYNENVTTISLAEYFQNEMLLIDGRVKYLKRTILHFSRKMAEEEQTYQPGSFEKKQTRLRENMVNFEKQFLNLSNDFNARMAKFADC